MDGEPRSLSKNTSFDGRSRLKVVQRPATTAKKRIYQSSYERDRSADRSNPNKYSNYAHFSSINSNINNYSSQRRDSNYQSLVSNSNNRQQQNNKLLAMALSKNSNNQLQRINNNSINNNMINNKSKGRKEDQSNYQKLSPQNESLMRSIHRLEELQQSANEMMKEIVRQQIVLELSLHDPFFKRIERNLCESIFLICKLKTYEEEEAIGGINELGIGFLVYGSVKVHNKDYRYVLCKGDTYGEHNIFEPTLNFPLKARARENSCFLWLPKRYYTMLREESIRNGLKSEVNQMEVLLRLSFIKKKMKEPLKKMHI